MSATHDQEEHPDYYPEWLDNLADDVILQAAVMNGEVRGAAEVKTVLSFARSLYTFQDFRFYGHRGELWLEDYRAGIRGNEDHRRGETEIYNFVVVYFNDAGRVSQLVMNHRPLSAALQFSSILREHFGDSLGQDYFYWNGDVDAHLRDEDLSRGRWPDRNPALP